jgi:hypothetical protein
MLGGAEGGAAVESIRKEMIGPVKASIAASQLTPGAAVSKSCSNAIAYSTAANRIAEIKPIATLLFSRLSFQAPARQLFEARSSCPALLH